MVKCSQCGAENQTGALFCEMCGTRLAVSGAAAPPPQGAAAAVASTTCPTCGDPAIPGEAFCDNCGAPLGLVPGAAAPVAPPQPVPAPPAQPAPQPVYPPPQPLSAAPARSDCPACGTAVIPGEAFCDTCGAALNAVPHSAPAAPVAPAALPVPPTASPVSPAAPAVGIAPPPQPASATSLQGMTIEIASASVPLPAKQEAILGRQDPASGHFPDIDLTPYGAFESGVGRRHARFLVRNGQVLIEDLDSTNGTLVNRQRLQPRQPVPLSGGEEIRLGKLAFTFRRGAA